MSAKPYDGRYIGNVLGWVHQAAAEEAAFLTYPLLAASASSPLLPPRIGSYILLVHKEHLQCYHASTVAGKACGQTHEITPCSHHFPWWQLVSMMSQRCCVSLSVHVCLTAVPVVSALVQSVLSLQVTKPGVLDSIFGCLSGHMQARIGQSISSVAVQTGACVSYFRLESILEWYIQALSQVPYPATLHMCALAWYPACSCSCLLGCQSNRFAPHPQDLFLPSSKFILALKELKLQCTKCLFDDLRMQVTVFCLYGLHNHACMSSAVKSLCLCQIKSVFLLCGCSIACELCYPARCPALQSDQLLDHTAAPPADLTPLPVLSKWLGNLTHMMDTLSKSPSESGDQGDQQGEFAAVLSAVIDPLVTAHDRSSNAVADPGARLVMMINCYSAIIQCIQGRQFTKSKTEKLQKLQADLVDELVRYKAKEVLSVSGLQGKLEIMSRHSGVALSTVPETSQQAISDMAQDLYTQLFSVGGGGTFVPQIEFLQSPELRKVTSERVATAAVDSYSKVYNAVLDPANQYSNPSAVLSHTPDQVRALLGLM